MKQLYFFLRFIPVFVALGLSAQNYRSISAQTENYYYGNPGFLSYNFIPSIPTPVYVLRSDSMTMQGANQIFHTVRNFRNEISNSGWNCVEEKDTGFAGAKIMLMPNGYDVFFNQYGDSIKIKTDAGTGMPFVMYQFPNGDYFEATVVNVDPTTFVSNDSTKRFSIQLKNSAGNPLSHQFNSKEIHISKNYGLIQSYDWLRFPNDTSRYLIAGCVQSGTGVNNLTAQEIFDFSVGDIFEYHQAQPPTIFPPMNYTKEWCQHKVLSKTISSNADSVTYGYDRLKLVYSYTVTMSGTTGDTAFIHDTIFESIKLNGNLLNEYSMTFGYDSSFTWNYLYNKYGDSPDGYNVQHSESEYNGRMQKSKYTSYNGGAGCLQESMGWCVNRTSSFAEGLGFVQHLTYSGTCLGPKEMVYFKKGAETWGTPIDWNVLLGENEIQFAKQISVFPNPAQDFVYFNGLRKESRIAIYDAAGALVFERLLQHQNASIDVSPLAPGIYFFRVTGDEKYYGKFSVVK